MENLKTAYEMIFIVVPNLTEEDTKAVIEKFNGVITANGGEVEKVEEWGKRKLAYEINDFTEGYYVLVEFNGPAGLPAELERLFGISDDVMRSLVIRKDQ